MKSLFAVALLVNLNLYTMECFEKENKPSHSINQRYTKYYNKLISTKHAKKNKQPGCFTRVYNEISRVITHNLQYLNQ